MKSSTVLIVGLVSAVFAFTFVAQTPSTSSNQIVERVDNTGFIELRSDSFGQLDAQHQALAYWLVQASIAIDPIIYDQLSRFGIREKRLLEEIVARPDAVDPR